MEATTSLAVLVIEDDPGTRANLRDILELDDYLVETAGSAAEALRQEDWAQFSAVLLDRRLPDGTAEDLLPRLRQLSPQAAILIVTGYADLEGAIAAFRHGVTDYILKPINPDELRARLRRIAEHLRAERHVQAQTRLLRSVLENISDAVFVADAEGKLLLVNPAAERMCGPIALGVGPEAWPQRQYTFLPDTLTPYPPDQLALVRALHGEDVQDLEEFLRPPGHIDGLWVSASASPLRDARGVQSGAVLIFRDITGRKRAEEALRQQRDLAEGLIETAQAIVLVLEPQGRIVRFNRYLEELAGHRLRDVRDQDWFATFLPGPEAARLRDEFLRTLPTGESGNIGSQIITADGQRLEIQWSNKVLQDAQGKVTGMLAIGQDVTTLREAQQRAVQSERLAAIGQMMTVLAHESGNALARSRANLEMLTWEVEDRPEAVDLIRRIELAQGQLQQLYQEVRNYAAPIQLERESWDLAGIWRQAWENLAVARQGRQTLLREETDGVALECAVDSFRLDQVFRNILENALAACPDPVQIDVRCANTTLEGRLAVCVTVQDNGPGLKPEQQQRIFEPFFTTKAKGTGLGMAIAKRIVEAHGGRLEVGANGPGAEIHITLPREAP